MDLQTKVEGLYAAVSDGFYRNIPELEVTTGKTRAKYNSALLFSTLTALNNGKILLFGEYGGGKTTSSEYVLSLFRGIPLDILQSAQIRGHPELTEEKTVGRPDLAKMNRGIGEEVVWEFFPLLPGHIIDEINRIPESKQSIILEGVGRGIWRYLREIIFTGKTPLFATNNYADKGNMELIPPMKDRFDVAVESRFPGVEHSLDIMLDYENPLDERLRNEDISAQMREALQDGRTARERLAPLLEQYRGHLAQSLGVETLSAAELRQISEEIRATPLDQQATMLMRVLISELNWSPDYGQKRSGELPRQGHDRGYLFNRIENAGSRRMEKAIVHYARSLAWLTRSDSVDEEHIGLVAPYAMWHRVTWTEDFLKELRDHTREDPLELYAAKHAVAGLVSRWGENQQWLTEFFGDREKALRDGAAFHAFEEKYKDHQHPIFRQVIQETRRQK